MRRDDDWPREAVIRLRDAVLRLPPIEPSIYDKPPARPDSWAKAEANADRYVRGDPPEWPEPPVSTLHAARYVAALNDDELAEAFVAGRSPAECRAILEYLKRLQR